LADSYIADSLPTQWLPVNYRSDTGEGKSIKQTDVLTTEPRRQPPLTLLNTDIEHTFTKRVQIFKLYHVPLPYSAKIRHFLVYKYYIKRLK